MHEARNESGSKYTQLEYYCDVCIIKYGTMCVCALACVGVAWWHSLNGALAVAIGKWRMCESVCVCVTNGRLARLQAATEYANRKSHTHYTAIEYQGKTLLPKIVLKKI